MDINNILWPTDGMNPSKKVVDAVVTFAQQFGAKIFALNVVPPIPMFPESAVSGAAVSTFDVGFYERELIETSQKSLFSMLKEHIPSEIEADPHVTVGQPRDIILNFVNDKKIDMIVMATHGRSGIDRWLIGSVTESTIRQSPVPLFIIPLDQEETAELSS